MRLWFLFVALSPMLGAAPFRQDLGPGLVYVRTHQLPADLPGPTLETSHSTILDVRYVTGDAAAGSALTAWLKSHATLRTPVLLLVNNGTAPALLADFASADAIPGLVVIGPAQSKIASDIAIDLATRHERKAYDALEAGMPWKTLTDDNPDKVRNDEARLASDHISDAELAAASDTGPLHDSPPGPTPLIDTELQRAIQLYRALQALKRI